MKSTAVKKEKRKLPDLLKPAKKKRPVWKTILLCAGGVFFVVLGAVGTVLATGIPFFFIGFAFFAICFPPVRNWVNRGEKHLPTKFRIKLRRMLQKIPIAKVRAMFSKMPSSHQAVSN